MNILKVFENQMPLLVKRIKREVQSYDIAFNSFTIPNDGSILPLASDLVNFNRITKKVSSPAYGIVKRKLDGILGQYNYSSTSSFVEQKIKEHDIEKLLYDAAIDLIVRGVTALYIRANEQQKPVLDRVDGFILPVKDDENTYLLNILQNEDLTFTVRLFENNKITFYENLKDFKTFTKEKPTNIVITEQKTFFFSSLNEDDKGFSHGEIEVALELFIAHIATQARLEAISELSAFPRPVVTGSPINLEQHSISNAIVLSEGGSFKWVNADTPEALFKQLELIERQISFVIPLPPNSSLSNIPSGIAIQEISKTFNNNIDNYAKTLSSLFTEAFTGLAQMYNINNSNITFLVVPQKFEDKTQQLEFRLKLLEKNLFTIEAFLLYLQSIFPELTDNDLTVIKEEFKKNNNVLTTEKLLQVLQ